MPYQWQKSQKLAGDGARRFIGPIDVKDEPADNAINAVLPPMGLAYAVDDSGVYLQKAEKK